MKQDKGLVVRQWTNLARIIREKNVKKGQDEKSSTSVLVLRAPQNLRKPFGHSRRVLRRIHLTVKQAQLLRAKSQHPSQNLLKPCGLIQKASRKIHPERRQAKHLRAILYHQPSTLQKSHGPSTKALQRKPLETN